MSDVGDILRDRADEKDSVAEDVAGRVRETTDSMVRNMLEKDLAALRSEAETLRLAAEVVDGGPR